MSKNAGWLALAGLLALTMGCVTARYVELLPKGGTVAIRTQTARDRAAALELIARKCPGGYRIDREEEEVVGTFWRGESTEEYDRIFDETRRRDEVTTRPRTEWRIHFTCK